MPTVTIRPNAIYDDSPVGAWTNVGGAASREAAMAHGSNVDLTGNDATFMKGRNDNNPVTRVKFGAAGLPANALITDVKFRIRLREETDATAATHFSIQGGVLRAAGFDGYYSLTISDSQLTNAFQNFTSASWPLTQNSGFYTGETISSPAEADELELYFSIGFMGVGVFPSAGIAAVAIDIIYNAAPIVTVTAPTEGGSVTTTTRPTVTWTYSDADFEAQERYRVKIFSAAQYGIGGFDPETSPNTWDSGEIFGTATTVNIPIDLTNSTTYRAYVKASDAGSNGRYSVWDNNTFTINVAAPPAPALVVTAQPTDATGPRTKLDITRTSHATPTTYMIIEYSDNAGTSWNILRGASNIVNSPDGTTFTFYDYEATPGVQRSYRAKAVRTV